MADDIKYGHGAARSSTIKELSEKKERLEQQKQKSMLREQIIFIFIAMVSVSPIVAAFMSKDDELSFLLFKIGGATIILLYPSYLILRAIIGAAIKSKK